MYISKEQQDLYFISGLRAKDEKVFKEVYDLYWSKLYVSAFNVLRNREQSEDVVQEVFSSLWHQSEDVSIQNLAAWLFTAVRYKVFNILRSGKVRGRYEKSYIQELEINNIGELRLDSKDLQSRLVVSMDQLPPRCKEIFILSRFEYLSYKEIALRLNISEKTVENQISIALKKLRQSLSDLAFLIPLIFYK